MSRILIAPDSFKGTIKSREAGQALAKGWLQVHPEDEVQTIAFADGGEGTLDCIMDSINSFVKINLMAQSGDGRPHSVFWLLLDNEVAVIEMALICGISTINDFDALGAHSFGLGEVIADACSDPRVKEILVAVGGSASTDGGVGALAALGVKFLDTNGQGIELGGGAISQLVRIDKSFAISLPERGVKILVDVQSSLTGNEGSANIFAPQKGANKNEVLILEKNLMHLLNIADVLDLPGYGAAGGVAFGLSALWGAQIVSGAQMLSKFIGLDEQIKNTDCVITGEGSFDSQSFSGKVVGYILEKAASLDKPVFIACGVNKNVKSQAIVSLVELAQSEELAMSQPHYWLTEAGKILATRFND